MMKHDAQEFGNLARYLPQYQTHDFIKVDQRSLTDIESENIKLRQDCTQLRLQLSVAEGKLEAIKKAIP